MSAQISLSRIILSRKGFDSSNGRRPSPIFPDGRLCPLPIPEVVPPGKITYDRLCWGEWSLAHILADLGVPDVDGSTYAHPDPDLYGPSRDRHPGWRPVFGQANAAEGHLRKQGVGPGDLFLYYGWFRETEWRDGRLRYKANAPDRHVIYGWLQVERRLPLPGVEGALPGWAAYHPHVKPVPYGRVDSLYLSTSELRVPGLQLSLPGGGLFPIYDERLCLTAPGRSRSIWSLPAQFHPGAGRPPLTYHADPGRWQRDGEQVILRTVSRGQEFVLQVPGYPESLGWLRALFSCAALG